MTHLPTGFQSESNRTPVGFPVRENMCARLRDQRPETEGHLASHSQLVDTRPAPTTTHLEQPPAMRCEKPIHKLTRSVSGHWLALDLPLCWDADQIQRNGADYDTEDWFTAWDHDAIDPTALIFATAAESVTCPDCLEWMHA